MNKKTLLVGLLSLGLLASCGGTEPAAESTAGQSTAASKASSSKHEHTFDETKWEANDSQHWHPATCEHTTQKGSAAAHTLVVDATKTVAATCETAGTEVSVCSVCGHQVTKTVDALGHSWSDGTKTGVVTPENCVNGCKAYRFDVADATGWNTATSKMNGKPDSSGPTANSQSAWTVDATSFPAGTYDVYVIGQMTYSSHSDRVWSNMWQTDTAETPDTEDQSAYRYWIEIGTNVYNPNVTETWGELGYTADGLNAGLLIKGMTVEAGATEIKLEHGNIGYSMIINALRFVAK